jgi:hypothetical protein
VPAQRTSAVRLFVSISAKEAAEDFHYDPSRVFSLVSQNTYNDQKCFRVRDCSGKPARTPNYKLKYLLSITVPDAKKPENKKAVT